MTYTMGLTVIPLGAFWPSGFPAFAATMKAQGTTVTTTSSTTSTTSSPSSTTLTFSGVPSPPSGGGSLLVTDPTGPGDLFRSGPVARWPREPAVVTVFTAPTVPTPLLPGFPGTTFTYSQLSTMVPTPIDIKIAGGVQAAITAITGAIFRPIEITITKVLMSAETGSPGVVRAFLSGTIAFRRWFVFFVRGTLSATVDLTFTPSGDASAAANILSVSASNFTIIDFPFVSPTIFTIAVELSPLFSGMLSGPLTDKVNSAISGNVAAALAGTPIPGITSAATVSVRRVSVFSSGVVFQVALSELSAVSSDQFKPPVLAGTPGAGIGGYDLADPSDQIFAFDYDSNGKADCLTLYRPGHGVMWILKNSGGTFTPVYGPGSIGIGGYDLADPADQAFAFDYDSTGKLDHLALYRPSHGVFWIVKHAGGAFTAIYGPGSVGIAGYDFASAADQAFAFDYDSTGKLDHLVLYRPGTGTIWIVKNTGGTFTPVYGPGSIGIGGYDLADAADRAFAFDYDGTGKRDHLVLYRPGHGVIWILKHAGGAFTAVYGPGSIGIGGYDLADPTDRVFAYDYESAGKFDHLVLYRPGHGTIWILKNNAGSFSSVYAEGDPGIGIGGFDLANPADRATTFDFDETGRQDHLVLYRPGAGTIFLLKKH
jgi:hypothetical protein